PPATSSPRWCSPSMRHGPPAPTNGRSLHSLPAKNAVRPNQNLPPEKGDMLNSSDFLSSQVPSVSWPYVIRIPGKRELRIYRCGKGYTAASAQLLPILCHFTGMGDVLLSPPADPPLPVLAGVQNLLHPSRPGDRFQFPQHLVDSQIVHVS